MRLQERYGKEGGIVKKGRLTVEGAIEKGRGCMDRLGDVAVAANELVESVKGSDQYCVRVTKKRFNVLKGTLEALRKEQE